MIMSMITPTPIKAKPTSQKVYRHPDMIIKIVVKLLKETPIAPPTEITAKALVWWCIGK
jgi:hypothetical protein